MALTMEAVVREGSDVAERKVSQINEQYEVFILSDQRRVGSLIGRDNPKPDWVIKSGDRLEFRGEVDKVMHLFEKCETQK